MLGEVDTLDLAHQHVCLGLSDDGLDLGGGHQLLPQGQFAGQVEIVEHAVDHQDVTCVISVIIVLIHG